MAAYWEIAAHLAYDIFPWFKYLSVNLVFHTLGFWSGHFFLIAPFPDHCLLVPSHTKEKLNKSMVGRFSFSMWRFGDMGFRSWYPYKFIFTPH